MSLNEFFTPEEVDEIESEFHFDMMELDEEEGSEEEDGEE